MDIQNLIHMANRIGEFFQSMPDKKAAKEGISQHIEKFWEPRMRNALLQHLDMPHSGRSENDLISIVREAVSEHREKLLPKK